MREEAPLRRPACQLERPPIGRSWSEEHQLSVGEARLAPGVVGQHQREQAVDLGLVGQQVREEVTEPDRFRGQVDAEAVALVEDQVDDGEHDRQALPELIRGRTAPLVAEDLRRRADAYAAAQNSW